MRWEGAASRWRELLVILTLAGCAEEAGSSLSGSEGEVRSLAFDRVELKVQRPGPGQPPTQLLLQYVEEATGDKPAVLVIRTATLRLEDGGEYDLLPAGQAPLVDFYWMRGGLAEYPALRTAKLSLEHWSATEASGKFLLVFAATGRMLKGTFAGALEELVLGAVPKKGRRLAAGDWRPETGGRRLAAGDWRPEAVGCYERRARRRPLGTLLFAG